MYKIALLSCIHICAQIQRDLIYLIYAAYKKDSLKKRIYSYEKRGFSSFFPLLCNVGLLDRPIKAVLQSLSVIPTEQFLTIIPNLCFFYLCINCIHYSEQKSRSPTNCFKYVSIILIIKAANYKNYIASIYFILWINSKYKAKYFDASITIYF